MKAEAAENEKNTKDTRPVSDVVGCDVLDSKGLLGSIVDVLFDDSAWIVRYFSIEAGSGRQGRQVLISPVAVESIDWDSRRISLALTREKIDSGPAIAADLPPTRRDEEVLVRHFGWMPYWGATEAMPLEGVGGTPQEADTPQSRQKGLWKNGPDSEPKLRWFRRLTGLRVVARDRRCGKTFDAMAAPTGWVIGHLAVATRRWLPGGRVLVPLAEVDRVDWRSRRVYTHLTSREIKAGPVFNPARM